MKTLAAVILALGLVGFVGCGVEGTVDEDQVEQVKQNLILSCPEGKVGTKCQTNLCALCKDRKDNDDNGLIDCADSACKTFCPAVCP